ncbi:transposase [Nitratidesulfovibrio vulgaris]|nr:transposase [Nitratidesulfovibrio vulgaris]WCB47090.1 transposase [Nitratidesulfovibrio vulgaris]
MDMWEPYFKATLKHVPGAAEKIVHDQVRKQEHRELMGQEDHRLKGTKFLWLYREESLPDKQRPPLEALKAATLKAAKAWAMKEGLNDVWKYLSTGWARRFVKRWLT